MESKVKDFLTEWALNFVKNKDAISKKIVSIEKNKNGFDLFVKHKDKEQFIIVMPSLASLDGAIKKLTNSSHFTIVALSSKENFKMLVQNWKTLVEFKFLNVMFANPFSNLDKKWIIFPHTHNKICDEHSLELGLKSMFEMVEQIDEEGVLKKLEAK
ncbi:MAG TPA: hypothetical protein VI564_01345 [Candidatus Nanoarchaeia archaeon]|nr:hypothetical protein [Candidatus Nanoarchaeia archaeon]